MSVDNPPLQVNNLWKSFPGSPWAGLKNFSAGFSAGNITLISGQNGVGKTVFAKGIAGLLPFDHGKIFVGKREYDVRQWCRSVALRERIEFVPQSLPRTRDITGYEFLALNTMIGGRVFRTRYIRSRVDFLAARLKRDYDLDLGRTLDDYSITELQSLYFVRALLSGARYLVLDEPTASLNGGEAIHLMRYLYEISHDQKVTVIMIAHPSQFQDVPTSRYQFTSEGLREWVDDSPALPARIAPAAYLAEPSILKILTDYSTFDIPRGAIISIEGPESSHLCRAFGEAAISGRQWKTGLLQFHPARERIGYIPPGNSAKALVLEMDLTTNVLIGSWEESMRLQNIGLYCRKRAVEYARRIISAMKVDPDDPDMLVRNLSGGNQQRLLIGRETQSRDLFVAYELFRGLDNQGIHLAATRIFGRSVKGMTTLLFSPNARVEASLADERFRYIDGRIVKL